MGSHRGPRQPRRLRPRDLPPQGTSATRRLIVERRALQRYTARPVTGIWSDMVADYTFVDLPGSGTAVVWSWSFAHDSAALSQNVRLVDGLSWPGG